MINKKYFFSILFSILIGSFSGYSIEIERIEPSFWWTGMKNKELQLLVHGKDIASSQVTIVYPGVRLKEVVRVENPNYLFIYLDISSDASPGTIHLDFTLENKSIRHDYELKTRNNKPKAQGFDSSDVMYLIMPDRFANGNTANDEWDKVKIDRNDPFGRHGGDFSGISKHLDYISELGITTIWLNPVLENKMPEGSYHGYSTTDFYQTDPRFGTNQDYCNLIDEIHSKGMKIVMDMIYNHCGSHHWWMNDFPCSDWLNHQEGFIPTSHDLYTIMDPHAPKSEIQRMTDGWFVPAMPDLNQRNPHLATYLIQNSIWWIEYAGIDGIRHDTHPYADIDFLSRWCKAVSDEYPLFNIVGESWYVSSGPLAWWQQDSHISDRQSNLKTVMDFSLKTAIETAFSLETEINNPLWKIYEILAQDFLYSNPDNLLIFLDNHDTSRFFKEGETDLKRFKQAIAFLLTTRGIPQLYYGTELLMYGEKKDGDGNLRKDIPGGWPKDTINNFDPSGRTELQNEAWNYIQTLLKWRKNNPDIVRSELVHYAPDYQTECYVYARKTKNKTILVILNGSEKKQTLPMNRYYEVTGSAQKGKDIITGQTITLKENIKVEPKGVWVIEYEN